MTTAAGVLRELSKGLKKELWAGTSGHVSVNDLLSLGCPFPMLFVSYLLDRESTVILEVYCLLILGIIRCPG